MREGEKREGFVTRPGYDEVSKTPSMGMTKEEMNLIRKINNRTNELHDCLRSAESLSENVNKKLLPLMEEPLLKEAEDKQAPSGWFEEHLADIGFALRKAVNTLTNLQNLSRETKSEQK